MSFFDAIVTKIAKFDRRELTLISHEIQAVLDGINALQAQLATAQNANAPMQAKIADLQAQLDAANAKLAQDAQDKADELAALAGALNPAPAPTAPAAPPAADPSPAPAVEPTPVADPAPSEQPAQ